MAEVGSAFVTIIPSVRGFAGRLSRQLQRPSQQAGQSSGRLFGGGFGKALGGVGAGLGIAAIVKQSTGLEQSFSKTMRLVAASTGAPASQIGKLNALAMKLGADTQFSANQAADAMLELGKAGISTSDIMGGALKGTLLLAAAGGTDLGTAATIASNAMNTFNLRGKDMNTIASALAGGANASSASVESLGQALSQVGPGAKNAGLNLQQTVGVLSAFDAAGIKGSDAGTSLKTMLQRLIPTTQKQAGAMKDLHLNFVNADGSFKSITQIAGQLHKSLSGLSESQRSNALNTIFGADASRAAAVLMDKGAKGVARYIKATRDQGAAQKMANAAMAGTSGAMERLHGAIETAELALGRALAPTITSIANTLSTKVLPAVTGFIAGMQSGAGAGGRFASALGSVAGVISSVFGFIAANKEAVGTFAGILLAVAAAVRIWAVAQAILNAVLTANPIGIIVVAIAAFAAGLVLAYKHSQTFRDVVQAAFRAAAAGARALGAIGRWLWNNAFQPAFQFILSGISKIIGAFAKVIGVIAKIPGPQQAAMRKVASALDGAARHVDDLSGKLRKIPDGKAKVTVDTAGARAEVDGFIRLMSGRTIRIGTHVGNNAVARASGGPLAARQLAVVGENGPELFRPRSAGTVIPNHKLGFSSTPGADAAAGLSGPVILRVGDQDMQAWFERSYDGERAFA